MLVKSKSKRLPGKNLKDWKGEPMFLVNLKKCFSLFPKTYVSSDSEEILDLAQKEGAIPILRGEELCGDVPNITVYKHALQFMDCSGIVAVQANSPNVKLKTIETVKNLLEMGYDEIMTSHPTEHKKDYHAQNLKIYGSVWGLSRERLLGYGNPYRPNPQVLVVDESIDIETEEDYNKSLWL